MNWIAISLTRFGWGGPLVEKVKHFSAVDGKGFLLVIKGVVDARLDGPVHRVRTVIRPVIALAGIGKLDLGDVLDVLVTVLERRDQPQGKSMIS